MHEPRADSRPHRSPRAESIAAQLAALTGSTPRLSVGAGRTRIETDLPPVLSDAGRHMLYATLASADDYGHEPDGGYIWVELHTRLPDPGALTSEQLQGLACAWCGARLYTCRSIGTIQLRPGLNGQLAETAELMVCSPVCATRHP
ncbi:hypothetical protein [Streptomyces sparsogenes]|uniref:Uncharacterized protein n=1 Tax=Streptomyces sparsogenes DSM 40356 TaxID=1331668 RepID=A0A1R1S7Y8_9ACTN|nr:hypothetical protein [Streptomyces sparsogenes]OMI34343.1 hypothetical protein SPAR_36206 [Streptomyces sparsogenes DSM 40356]